MLHAETFQLPSVFCTTPQQVQTATAPQESRVPWVTKAKRESRAEWKAAEDLRVRREKEAFQVRVPENGIYLLFVSAVGVTGVTKCSIVWAAVQESCLGHQLPENF